MLDAVIDELLDEDVTGELNLANATDVILVGHSAGAVGVVHNLDAVADKLPCGKFAGISDAAFAPAVLDLANPRQDTIAQHLEAAAFHNKRIDASCETEEPLNQRYHCLSHTYVGLHHRGTPLFVHMDQLDSYFKQGPRRHLLEGTLEAGCSA